MDYTLLVAKLTSHYKDKLPFVLFCLPENDFVTAYFQKDSTTFKTDNFSEKSVIFAPFDFKKTAFCIPASASEVVESFYTKQEFPYATIFVDENSEEKENHIKIINEAKKDIRYKKASKIVLARRKKIAIKGFNLSKLAPLLLNLYPKSFRYIWYHPETGLWCGATPEVLLETRDSCFTTMALAGTQNYIENGNQNWTDKEYKEQELVSDAITTSLQKVTSVVKVSKIYTQRAGTLAHLRTDITGFLKNNKTTLTTVAAVLHPTPAVCGSPRAIAKKFILDKEGYSREYYAGFIGPVNEKHLISKLFVNLRCMKIVGKTAYLYSGGGITNESIPEEEWEETRNKLQTMLRVLQPFLY